MTNLVAGILAGTLEAILVVAPVETVKTRLVDADQARAVGVSSRSRSSGSCSSGSGSSRGGGSTGGGGGGRSDA